MSSLKQIAANRLNAERSTGPKTDEGKSLVSRNALKHGLLSSQTLLPGEETQALDELRQNLTTELQAQGQLEILLVDRIAALYWRLGRAGKIEAALLAVELYGAEMKRVYEAMNSCSKRPPSPFSSEPEKIKILDQQKYDEALKWQAEVRARMNGEEQALARGFIERAAYLTTLHRYETTLERSLFKALHELQRVQAMRLGVKVTLPVAVDIQGDGRDS